MGNYMILLGNIEWHELELPPINLYNAPRK